MKTKLKQNEIKTIISTNYVRSKKNVFTKTMQKLIDQGFYSLCREMYSETEFTLTANRTRKGDLVAEAMFVLTEAGVV